MLWMMPEPPAINATPLRLRMDKTSHRHHPEPLLRPRLLFRRWNHFAPATPEAAPLAAVFLPADEVLGAS